MTPDRRPGSAAVAAKGWLRVLPLTDPYVLVQSFLAGHAGVATGLLGGFIVFAVYAYLGGRFYCSFVCPMNVVTDAAHWLAERLRLAKGWQPRRQTRLWILAATLVVASGTGTIAWETLNPVSILHRGLVFGVGAGWTVVAAVFVFDLVVSRRGWCGHLCPVGAFYGLVGSFGLVRVSAKGRAACDLCMDCYVVCPESHAITPALRPATADGGPIILSRDCTNCGRCIDVCARDVFAFDLRFHNTLAPGDGRGDRETAPMVRRAA
jgi:ferredoxin-type protein NapH